MPEISCIRRTSTYRPKALSKLLHTEDHAHAGVMIDGPNEMKSLVEAFAKQVCVPCLCCYTLHVHLPPPICLHTAAAMSCMQSSFALHNSAADSSLEALWRL